MSDKLTQQQTVTRNLENQDYLYRLQNKNYSRLNDFLLATNKQCKLNTTINK